MKTLSLASVALAIPAAGAMAAENSANWRNNPANLRDLIAAHRAAVDEYMHWSDLAEEIEFNPTRPKPKVEVCYGYLSTGFGEKTPLYARDEKALRKVGVQMYETNLAIYRDIEKARVLTSNWFDKHLAELKRAQRRLNDFRHRTGLVRIEREWERATKIEVDAAAALLAYGPANPDEAAAKRAYLSGANGVSVHDLLGWDAVMEALVERLCECAPNHA